MAGDVLIRRLVGVALMVDGLAAALWMTTLLGSFGARDGASVAAVIVRVCAGALAVIAGWLVSQRRPPGEGLAVAAALLTAAIETAGAWSGWLPTNRDPVWRIPVAAAYWVAAAGIAWWVRHRMRQGDAT